MNMDTSILLLGLFASAFLSATLLPASSEVAFVAFISQHDDWAIAALTVATIGNSAGSLSSYFIARKLPEKHQQRIPPKILQHTQRYGASVLILAWLPIVGDALPLAAGWLRLNVWRCAFWIILGKWGRYAFLWLTVQGFQAA